MTSISTNRSENPTAFSTASSRVRSRTAIAIVLPVTSRSVKNTTLPTLTIRSWILPICLTNDAANAFSVSVLVSAAEFANSPAETKTDTEKAFAASFVKQMGNIQLLIVSVGSVVFFTLLLVTGNTMAIAVRERTRELAVLKAVGFSDRFVLMLVIAETMVVAVVGGGVGVGLAKLFTLRGDPTGGLLPFFYLASDDIVLGLGLALTVGLAAGVLPALS